MLPTAGPGLGAVDVHDDGEVVGEAVDAVQEVDVPPDLENLELPGLERVVLV